jgi:hypothetical protein
MLRSPPHPASLRILITAGALLLLPALGTTQETHAHNHEGASTASAPDSTPSEQTMHGADHAMSGPMAASAHMKMTEWRAATPADSARAAAIADTLRRAIEKYRDVRLAVRDGFRQFAPKIKNQRVYHFTSSRHAFKEHFRFDPAQPTSLLYKKDASGQFELVGAMYVAPRDATPEKLDERIPLSVAQWHAHTNICVPTFRERTRWRETRNGEMVFGPRGLVATKADCEAEGGRFHPQVFGWMVHANVFASEDPAVVWGDGDAP